MASLTDKVVANLIEDIERGALRPGDKIPTEAALMKQLEVSRSVVREAVSRLQAANVVETRHGVGTFVRAPADREAVRLQDADLSSLLDILAIIEFRIDLEGAAAAWAAAPSIRLRAIRCKQRRGVGIGRVIRGRYRTGMWASRLIGFAGRNTAPSCREYGGLR